MSDFPYTLIAANDANVAIDDQIVPDLQAIEADIASGRLPQAAAALNKLQQANAGDARVYVAGWQLGTASQNYQAAVQAAERAIALAPRWPVPHYCAAQALQQLGNVPSATIAIENALELAPTNLQYREFAIMLANSVVDHAAAEKHLRVAFAQKPDIAGIKTLIGNALRNQSKLEEAKRWLNEAIASNPDDAEAQHSLGLIAYQHDELDSARAHLAEATRLRPDNAIFSYLNAVVNGATPAQPPEALTRNLFDGYASLYDRHLLGALQYRLPQLIADKIVAHFPSRTLNVLDLGCGTGLLGAALGKIDGHFAGVDLSLAMLKEAEKRNVYSRLHNVNLIDALAATATDDYDVIAAADVFIYVGSLDAVIADSFRVLQPGGWLFFSCEAAPEDGPDFVLTKSMRYTHTMRYAQRLLTESGFVAVTVEPVDLRLEQSVAVPGFLVAAQKPA